MLGDVVQEIMNTMPRTVLTLAGMLACVLTLRAGPQPSAELQKAMAAADRARATPKGQEYQNTFNASASLRDVMMSGVKECLPINAPGVRKPSGFQCVLILGKSGKPKWIIRDSRDAMAQCFYAKLVTRTYPIPPADNWPVIFGINMPR
jgi:hypothetical protein